MKRASGFETSFLFSSSILSPIGASDFKFEIRFGVFVYFLKMDRAYLRARLDRSFEESYDVFPMISLTNSAENESRPGERDFDNLSGTVAHGLLVSRFFKRLTRKYFEFRFNNIDRHRHTRTRALTTRDA